MRDVVISVENLGKKFLIGRQREGDFRNSFAQKIKTIFNGKKEKVQEEFWALKDISFRVKKGEAVAIIGGNGAGKSTLLKILSRITDPSAGRFEIDGRVSSLLEVGTGFHPELTGRENIFLNGTILGMSRPEIKLKFDEIVDFSGVEKFIDTPVKHYSSGMKVRLAFAVAAHLEPEILIVDEVLAVGDAEFQKKCLGKMNQVSKTEGRTVLFVSHNMAAIENLCNSGLLLEHGTLTFQGEVGSVVQRYQRAFSLDGSGQWISPTGRVEAAYFKSANASIFGEQPNHKLEVCCTITSQFPYRDSFLAVDIVNSIGVTIMQAIPVSEPFIKYRPDDQSLKVEISLPPLIPDVYRVSLWLGPHNNETICWEKEVLTFEITDSPIKGRTFPHYSTANGFMVPPSKLIA